MSGGRTHAANQWRFTRSPDSFTDTEKRLLFAEAVRIGISALFNLHLYSFANKTYLQKSGLPTGVRASCGLARLVGNSFDKELKKVLDKNKVVVDTAFRYLDDSRYLMLGLGTAARGRRRTRG